MWRAEDASDPVDENEDCSFMVNDTDGMFCIVFLDGLIILYFCTVDI